MKVMNSLDLGLRVSFSETSLATYGSKCTTILITLMMFIGRALEVRNYGWQCIVVFMILSYKYLADSFNMYSGSKHDVDKGVSIRLLLEQSPIKSHHLTMSWLMS